MTPKLKEKLTKILIDNKLIKEQDLNKAMALQKEGGGSLSDILMNLGVVSKNDLMVALSHELDIPPINLSRYKADQNLIKLIPKKVAKHYKVIPISKMGDILTVALSDPMNILAIDDIKALTGFKISMVIASEKDIEDAVKQYYEESAYTAIEKIVSDMDEGGIRLLDDGSMETLEGALDLLQMTQEAPVVKITNLLLAEGVNLRASDILIEPLVDEVRVRYRVDGILQEGRRSPRVLHNAIVSRLKVMSSLNIAERRLPQDGRFKVKLHGREVDFRISIIPASTGEKVALRILDKAQATLDIEKLGFDTKSVQELKEAAVRPHGLILLCGPTGCGKTTTLYSILQYVNSIEKNLVTVEDPVEYQIEGVNQVTSKPDIGLTFSAALRSILRQDPNVIMIGEIRDFETIDIAIKAALTGHLVLSTVHTTTATGSIIRLVNMGCEPFLIVSSMIAAGAQRLVRRICQECKEPYELDKETIGLMNIKPDIGKPTFYRGRGCEKCSRTGYRGRVGLIEVLRMTPKIRKLVLQGAQEHTIREEARRDGMKTLRETGIQNALAGITTLDEIVRVTIGDQELELR